MKIQDAYRTMTPLGRLDELDIYNPWLQGEILKFDKHQILEGTFFEEQFEAELGSCEEFASRFRRVHAQTALVLSRFGQMMALVLVEKRTEGLGRYLSALAKVMPVIAINYDMDLREFVARSVCFVTSETGVGTRLENPVPVNEYLAPLRSEARGYDIKENVRDTLRQNAAFYGGIMSMVSDEARKRIVIGRIFFNFVAAPAFKRVWNVDKVFVDDKDVYALEVKHKYPFWRRGGLLGFGLNVGEAVNMQRLAAAGIRNIHMITVKPVWSDEYSSLALLTREDYRRSTLIVAKELHDREIAQALKNPAKSNAKTSLTGDREVSYITLEADTFTRLGLKSDASSEVARRMVAMVDGDRLECCFKSDYELYRMQR